MISKETVKEEIEKWRKDVEEELYLYEYNGTFEDCFPNFFLLDQKDGTYWYGMNIYDKGKIGVDGNVILEYQFNGEYGQLKFDPIDYTEYVKFVETVAEYLDTVYIEIIDEELVDEDGYGRFWCNVNDKTYTMEYDEDWNNYVNYENITNEK